LGQKTLPQVWAQVIPLDFIGIGLSLTTCGRVSHITRPRSEIHLLPNPGLTKYPRCVTISPNNSIIWTLLSRGVEGPALRNPGNRFGSWILEIRDWRLESSQLPTSNFQSPTSRQGANSGRARCFGALKDERYFDSLSHRRDFLLSSERGMPL
jgi:hypothetical protein